MEEINKNSTNNKSTNNDNQQSIDNLLNEDKWLFKFNWNFRDELIKLLGEYTRLLITNKEILIDEKESIKNNKNELIKLLNESPLKLDEESSSYDICLNLDNNFKNKIINNLIKNENLIIYYKNKIDTNSKRKLIEENNHLINKIVNLPVGHSNDVNLVDDVILIDDDEARSGQSESEGEWILKLDWNFRVELIKLLGEYTRLSFTNKEISIDEKELIKDAKNDLIKLLNESPLELDKKSRFYEICLNLDFNFKDQIINQLKINENLIINCKNKIDTNSKSKLIEENNHLINKIINLPVGHSNDVNLVDGRLRSSQSEEKNQLKRKLGDDHNSINLHLIKKDMKKFFKKNNFFLGGEIDYRNIKWSIDVRSFRHQNIRYLSFFLNANRVIDDKNNVEWKCLTSFELILKNHLPGKRNKSIKFNQDLFRRSESHGEFKFITEDELFNLENGYMKDDSIKLEVNLNIHKISRFI